MWRNGTLLEVIRISWLGNRRTARREVPCSHNPTRMRIRKDPHTMDSRNSLEFEEQQDVLLTAHAALILDEEIS